MTSPCGNPTWNARCHATGNCVAGSPGQGCDESAGTRRCGSCYRARTRDPHSPILEFSEMPFFAGFVCYVITDPGTLALPGILAGDLLWQIDGAQVTKQLVAQASVSNDPLKVRYYRPSADEEVTIEVPAGAFDCSGYIGLSLSTLGPLGDFAVPLWSVVTRVNGDEVSPEMFVDLFDNEQFVDLLVYMEAGHAPRALYLT